MVENCAIRFAIRANLSMSATHRRCAGDPLGQVVERYPSQVGWVEGLKKGKLVGNINLALLLQI